MRRHSLQLAIATTLCLPLLAAASAVAAPPSIPLTTFSAVGTDSVTLEADVNPESKKTFYRFEYGPAPCSSDPCTSVPVPEGEIAPGSVPVRVKATIEGLSPNTNYHFRLVAKNGKNVADTTEGLDRSFTTFLPAQSFEPCANDQLRIGPALRLPECRAYEQASPVEKNGVSPFGAGYFLRSSLAGDAISFQSSSGIPGGEGAQDFPSYLASRGGQNWSTQGIMPNASAGSSGEVLGWTPDFSWVYDMVSDPSKGRALVARSSADGSLTTIVDYVPAASEYRFVASPDGSVVYFETRTQLLPAAVASKANLYVWERESDTIRLAGVLNDGQAPFGGSIAGPYDWVRGADAKTLATGGAALGYYLQDDRAVSADATSAVFTAGDTGQLYLRRNPTEPQSPLNGEGKCTNPALACTVHVSASQRTEGNGPGGTDSAGARPAAFQAASADGSKVFLTSSEKLTNDATTGPEPDTFPAIAKADADGEPVDVGFLPVSASGVELDGEHIYWINPEKETIARAELNGDNKDEEFISLPEVEVKPGESVPANPQDLAVDAEYIYWTNAAGEKAGEGTIGRAKKADGLQVDQKFIQTDYVVDFKGFGGLANTFNPHGIAVDSTHIYWGNTSSGGTLMRASLNGEGAENWGEFLNSISEPESNLPRHDAPIAIALDAEYAYYIGSTGSLFRQSLTVPLENAILRVGNALSGNALSGVAIDGSYLYWGNNELNSIGRYKLTDIDLDLGNFEEGKSAEKEFIKDAGFPSGLAASASHLYWSANQETQPNPGNDLYRYDTSTGKLADLVVDDAPNGAEVRGVLGASEDGSHIYFVANGVLSAAPNSEGESAVPGNCAGKPLQGDGTCNLYHWEEGNIEFVARLTTDGGGVGDAANWASTPAGQNDEAFQKTSRLSADGETLLFLSSRKLTDYENAGTPQLYRYDAQEESLLCVSCNPTGLPPTGPPTLGSIRAVLIAPAPPASQLSRNLSADGNRVFFESAEPLVAGDTNANAGCPSFRLGEGYLFPSCRDIYMWEAKGTGSCASDLQNGGCLYLLSTGTSTEPTFLADASLDGDDAFFLTFESLVRQDQDELLDVYDASANGGLAAQHAIPTPPCEGDACKAGAGSPPVSQSPGSAAFSGPGNPKAKPPKPRCPKGKRQVRRRGKVRCVEKRKGRAAKTKRRSR